jgi:hypothetical protein
LIPNRSHVDDAASKTINPVDAGAERVAEAYLEGWRLGLKRVTVYRRGPGPARSSRSGSMSRWKRAGLFAKCDAGARPDEPSGHPASAHPV